MQDQAATPDAFWEEFYQTKRTTSTGQPSKTLARFATDLPPGTALDLGSSHGDDVIWLASLGWQALGVDISPVAVGRAARRAERAVRAAAAQAGDGEEQSEHGEQGVTPRGGGVVRGHDHDRGGDRTTAVGRCAGLWTGLQAGCGVEEGAVSAGRRARRR